MKIFESTQNMNRTIMISMISTKTICRHFVDNYANIVSFAQWKCCEHLISVIFYCFITKAARSKHEYTSIICILQNLRFRFNVFSSRTRLRCEARIILFIFIFIPIDFSSIIQIYTKIRNCDNKQTISNRTTHSSSYKWKMRESHNKYDFE